MLQEGESADFILVDNLSELNVIGNYLKGVDILNDENINKRFQSDSNLNYLFPSKILIEDLRLLPQKQKLKAIKITEGELVTEIEEYNALVEGNNIISDINNDFLKVVIINRYKNEEISIGFINGFGLKTGAIAESIAHDSHHIIAIGVDDFSIFNAIQFVIEKRGGLSYSNGSNVLGLPLPVYGLMSENSAEEIAKNYRNINEKVIEAGCKIKAPFMTLSFMALSVIPKLKITPKGLFDVNKFDFIDQFC